MSTPRDRRYTETHEWARLEPDGTLSVGITHAGQEMLGDVVFAGDAQIGKRVRAGEATALVESVKAAVDVHAPVTGDVIAFNTALETEPQALNEKPFDTWIVRLRPQDAGAVDTLMDAATYDAATGSG